MIVVAIMGILAAVAIPALMKYIAKAKTSEARTQVEKMYSGARIYFMDPHAKPGSIQNLQPQFPDGTPPTPAASCCAAGGKCAPSQADWQTPSWMALQFHMSDPHFYQYQFLSKGIATTAEFTARAYGDLDCDGQYSTFSMFGRVQDGSVAGSAAISRTNETE